MTRVSGRRPGPRSDVDVPAMVVDMAERMFGQQGVDAVSLRAVARQAGVAPGAVLYHFPNKTRLVGAVVRRRGQGVGEHIRHNLARLLERRRVTSRDLVDAILRPLVDVLNQDPQGGLHWMKVFAYLGTTDDPLWHQAVVEEPSLTELFLDVATRALPDSDTVDTQTRLGIALFSMLTALAGADLSGYGHPIGPDGLDPRFVDQLARFTAAGIRAG